MANTSLNQNKFKVRSSKGYYGLTKGIITRNMLHLPKPVPDSDEEGIEENPLYGSNRWDVQIWIPAFHGGIMNTIYKTDEDGNYLNSKGEIVSKPEDAESFQVVEPDPEKVGTAEDVGSYPWAQVCAPILKDQIGDKKEVREDFHNVFSSMFYGKYNQDMPTAYPGIGDIVYVMFENGDMSLPVVMGSLLCDNNCVKYFDYDVYIGSGKESEVKKTLTYPGDSDKSLNLASRIEGRSVEKDDKEDDEDEQSKNVPLQ